jgi:hypothetical protein
MKEANPIALSAEPGKPKSQDTHPTIVYATHDMQRDDLEMQMKTHDDGQKEMKKREHLSQEAQK